jgi:hypothetical protein
MTFSDSPSKVSFNFPLWLPKVCSQPGLYCAVAPAAALVVNQYARATQYAPAVVQVLESLPEPHPVFNLVL